MYRLAITFSSFLLAAACIPPAPVTETGSSDGGGETDDTSVEVDPVWEDLSLETSTTLTGSYASGAGFYAIGDGGECWLRQNNQWLPVSIDVDEEDLNGLWGSGQGPSLEMMTVGDAGYVADWLEGAWSTEDLGTPNFESVDGASRDDLLAVGWGGVYRHSAEGWAYEAVEGNPRLNHVWYNGIVAVAVGDEGTIATYAAGGWSVAQDSSRKRLYGVTSTSTGEIIAVGEEGTVLHSVGGGLWESRDSGTSVSLWAVEAFDPTHVIAVGNNGTALLYDGIEWTPLPTGVDNNLYGVSISLTGTAWAIGNRGATLRMQL